MIINPKGPVRRQCRVLRSPCYIFSLPSQRPSIRHCLNTAERIRDVGVGFRVVMGVNIW